MTRSTRRTLAAALATATALAALFPVFQGAHWFWPVLGPVVVVALIGCAGRALRVPGALQPLLAVVGVAVYLVVVFAGGSLHHGLPTGRTVSALQTLVRHGSSDVDRYAPPVPATWGVVLLTAAGVGAVTIVVDLLAVVLGRVALAGLPLLALFAVPSAVLPGGLGGAPFAVGATGWLLLLLEEGSERVAAWGGPVRGQRPGDESSLGRLGRRIGVAAVGLAVVVPSVVPGLDHRLVGHGGSALDGGDSGPSHATTYNPLTRLQEELTLPRPRQLLVYSTDDARPDYLRLTTLDTYTGNGWSSSKLQADRDRAKVQKSIPAPPDERDSFPHRSVRTRIAVDGNSLAVHWLPVPYGPRSVDVQGTWLWDGISQTVFSASRTTQGLRPYEVRSRRVLPDREQLLATAGDPVNLDVQARYQGALQVSPAVEDLTRRVTRGAATPYDIAVAVQSYFTDPANGFVYDTRPSLPRPGQTALEAFLQGKHGFCEQYATAMAVLLRVAGVPSRVAVGFTAGTRVPGRQGVWSVTTSDAHAWPEAWFPGTGWVRFEPTPAAHGAFVPGYSTPALTGPGGGPAADGPQAAPRPRPSSSAFPRGFKDPDTLLGTTSGANAARRDRTRSQRWWLLAAALLAVLGGAPAAGAHLRRRARWRLPAPVAAWQQLREDVADAGHGWRPADSPRTAANRLASTLHGSAHPALERLATAVELARYAPAGRASTDGLQADATEVRRALLAALPRRARWRARLLPASTLRWAARGAAEGVADVLDVTDRFFATALRPARRLLRLRG